MSSWVYVTGQCPSICPSMGPQQQTHCCRFDAVGLSLSHTHTRLTALCPGLPGWAGSRKVKPIWILLRQWVAVASAGPLCKSAPRSRQITTPTPDHSVFLRAGCPCCHPTNSVTAGDINWLLHSSCGVQMWAVPCCQRKYEAEQTCYNYKHVFITALTLPNNNKRI